jgi:hypothetical protein
VEPVEAAVQAEVVEVAVAVDKTVQVELLAPPVLLGIRRKTWLQVRFNLAMEEE